MTVDFDNLTYEEARVLKDQLDQFLDSPGWTFVQEFLTERAMLRQRELVQMCPESVEQMVRFARIKGGIDELQLIPDMLGQIYSDVNAFVKDAQDKEEDDA